MKKDYLPMALGFWGVGLPLIAFGIWFCPTAAQKITVLILAGVFLLVGYLIAKAKR